MSDDTFDADWLALREPVDHRSRSEALVSPLVEAVGHRALADVLDLGGGTGSNVRWLAPRLPGVVRWTVVDHDAALLEALAPPSGAAVEPVVGDLAREGLAAVDSADLVTGSALLDLVGASWVDALVEACAARRCPALFALSYDGRIAWSEPDPDDARVAEAVNRHQTGPKGMGAALGPGAWSYTAEAFEAAGYTVTTAPSPWLLEGPDDAPLVRALVDGWIDAAAQILPEHRRDLEAWGRRRLDAVSRGVRLEVGHRDVLALPRGWP
ncbi:MAG: class I SAM-dependent methyltransferase [Longimicrobiales bacterium]